MTRKFKYTGDDPVDVPALGLVGVTKGTHVEVEEPALADGLDGQPIWEHIPDPKRSRAAKKAAAKKPAPPEIEPPEKPAASDDSQEG